MVRVLCVVALAGCNWVYGLDETSVRGPDLDGDGFVEDDLCPTLYTELQKDLDGDLVGDECDPCIDGAQTYEDADLDGVDDGCDVCTRGPGEHDEDRDGVVDNCDNCPGIAAPQDNDDNDDLGNACDPFPTSKQVRRAFAGFDVLPPGWFPNENFTQWPLVDDTIGPAQATTTSPADGLWNRDYAVDGNTPWMLETVISVPANPPPNFVAGIALRPRSAQFGITLCELVYNTTDGWSLVSGGGSPTIVTNLGQVARLRMNGLPNFGVRCSLDEQLETPPGATLDTQLTPVLFTVQSVTRFHYVDFLGAQ